MVVENEANYGSAWNKWDLHIHTKGTSKNDQFVSKTFDEFCNVMFKKALEKQIAVIGITDYFSIENYKKVDNFVKNILSNSSHFDENEKQQIKQIVIIPNVELRMLPTTNKGKLINIHCLFDPKYVSKLDNDFFNAVEFSYGNRKYRMNKNNLIDLGKAMGENDDEQAYKKGVENFAISHADLQKISVENAEFRKNTILVTSNSSVDGASGIQEHYSLFENDQNSSLEATRRAIYQLTDMIFSSNEGDIKYFSGLKNDSKEEVIKKCGSLKPCIHGSDAHTESKLFAPDNDRYCWIKAKPSFDGLKQVIYEIERVYIGKESPPSPLYKLEKAQLNFDKNTVWNNEKKDTFCFADFNQPLYFSPYFTCIIGGRGSGKSTLLNLIANKIDKLDDENKRKLPTDSKAKIILEPNAIDNIEFLAQNEIEEFATNSVKFTQAIFERLDKNSEMKLHKQEQEIGERIKVFDEQIKLLLQRNSLHKKLKVKKQELERQNNIIQTFNDKTYLTNKGELQEIGKKLLELNSSKERLKTLFNSLKEINTTHSTIDEPQNMYDKVLNESLSKIENLIQTIKNADYQKEKDEIATLEKNKREIEEQIYKYLQDKGLSENNIQDLKNVGEIIEATKNDINNMKLEIKGIKQKIIDFKIDEIDKIIKDFSQLVKVELDKINELFKAVASDYHKDIKTIKIEYSQNDVFEIICNEFIEILKQYFQIDIREKVTFKSYIKELELNNPNSTFKDIRDKINNFVKTTETSKILKEIFNNKMLFSVYHLLMLKNLRNIKNVKNFSAYYDEKILSNASFGQRCTAVIVILLALGNNPIIMDEPEAHLDSSLIANYLVELIKKQKKDRQIIFATHNANFVLNADAELIIKLSNDNNKITAQSFSIEDSENREDLLKLEGGKEAFKKRERKYEI
ncbi:TrlF family AAA-like ATPase [Helicobacter macacae]|uniref:AAA+ ATPase domain-containing protein n=1 Tax=Helicobacter macacae MIT 99-5501 TaxID=1357400 RepID=V8C9C7_9HELI|nr:AAA family ATPase [Helicobacter macacae]ETD23939.1 hypothetical protein HMPREF2086_00685 [Helicobacter macacae MIT 99-5501]